MAKNLLLFVLGLLILLLFVYPFEQKTLIGEIPIEVEIGDSFGADLDNASVLNFGLLPPGATSKRTVNVPGPGMKRVTGEIDELEWAQVSEKSIGAGDSNIFEIGVMLNIPLDTPAGNYSGVLKLYAS